MPAALKIRAPWWRVADLYFNTPRGASSRPETPNTHIATRCSGVALARPDMAMQLSHNGASSTACRRGDAPRRTTAALMGDDFLARHRQLDADAGPLRLSGFVSLPAYSRLQPRRAVLLREWPLRARQAADPCHPRGLHADILHGSRHPAYVLFLELDPATASTKRCNPAKIEVRFREARAGSPVQYHAVKRILAESGAGQDAARPAEEVSRRRPQPGPPTRPGSSPRDAWR